MPINSCLLSMSLSTLNDRVIDGDDGGEGSDGDNGIDGDDGRDGNDGGEGSDGDDGRDGDDGCDGTDGDDGIDGEEGDDDRVDKGVSVDKLIADSEFSTFGDDRPTSHSFKIVIFKLSQKPNLFHSKLSHCLFTLID